MIDFKLNPYLHKAGISTNILYHGSPIIINENNMASGTFFTIDKNIAKDYGKFIYSIELNEKIATIFYPDALREHLISCCLIPMYMFEIEECNCIKNNENMKTKEDFEKKLIAGTKIKIGRKYSEQQGFSEGEIITLEELSFEYDNDFGGGIEYAPGIFNGHDNDSIYHLFGNDFENWLDNVIIE